MPLLVNGNENLLDDDATLMSAASCKVAPTPTDTPLQAIRIGLRHLYILNARIPPESLLKSSLYSDELSNSELNVSLPADKSAPAQKAFPEAVKITALMLSLLSM